MSVAHSCLLNFAASYSGGGFKRLYEYAKRFDAMGGAWFVIHPQCERLQAEFPKNRYFVIKQSRLERLYKDCSYLADILDTIGRPQFYYSYGIPLYSRVAEVDWFHLSNILPLNARGVPLSLFDRLSVAFLGRQIRRGLNNAAVISAESVASLGHLRVPHPERLFLSVNGADDELAWLASKSVDEPREDLATVVGTYRHKALVDSLHVFQELKRARPELRLAVIGNPATVPPAVRQAEGVVIRGLLPRPQVMECLRRSRFYISTTRIENSYNAAAEGVFFAAESYISDIGPHRELLSGLPFEDVRVAGVAAPLLHVRRKDLTGVNLKSWETVVAEMMARFAEALRVQG